MNKPDTAHIVRMQYDEDQAIMWWHALSKMLQHEISLYNFITVCITTRDTEHAIFLAVVT